jgi:hypothetical protein
MLETTLSSRLDHHGTRMNSAWESFRHATLELVRSTPLKQRLVSAYRRHLAAVSQEQLPAEVRESFSQVQRHLSGVQPLPGEDRVAASVRKMSVQDADDCAASIVEIFALMSRLASASRPTAVLQLHALDAEPVPQLATSRA